jgi:hypothetical protein
VARRPRTSLSRTGMTKSATGIACIGWGSLIWHPKSLPLTSGWYPDGPELPIEFARHSAGDRVTLVLVSGAQPVRALWAYLRAANMDEAREALRVRESTVARCIGSIESGRTATDQLGGEQIADWCDRRGLAGAVWTALGPSWRGVDGVAPTIDEVVRFVREQGADSAAAEYVRRAPQQVATPFRTAIEDALGWRRG